MKHELKPIDYKILFELMADSKRSDRKLSKIISISQPTVTRRRTLIEKNYTEGYTVIPKFDKIGFEIAAITFLKSKKYKAGDAKASAVQKLKDWYMQQGSAILVTEGRGMGWDIVCISLHRNFADFSEFVRTQDSDLSEWIIESQTFNTDLKNTAAIKPFHFKYLAALKIQQ